MRNIIIILLTLFIGISLPLLTFASNAKPIICNHFQELTAIKKQIRALDKTFSWDNPNCNIVGTQSIFPRKDKAGKMQFETGLQLFVYQDDQLKFICLPGWVCKSW